MQETITLVRFAAYRLGRHYETGVSFEEFRPSNDPEIEPTDTMIKENQRRLQELLAKDPAVTPIEASLNELVAVAPEYTWTRHEATGMFNVFPREHSELSDRIARIDIRDKTILEILFNEDLLGLQARGFITSRRGNNRWFETRVSFQAQDVTFRDALNLLSKELPFPARWETWPTRPNQGTLLFGSYSRFPSSAAAGGRRRATPREDRE